MRLSTSATTAVSATALVPRAETVTLNTTISASASEAPLTVWQTVILPPDGGQPGIWHPPPSSVLVTAAPSATVESTAAMILTSTQPYSDPHWPPRITYTCRELYGQTPGVSRGVPDYPKTVRFCNTDPVTFVTVVSEAPKEVSTSTSTVPTSTISLLRPFHFSPPEDIPQTGSVVVTKTIRARLNQRMESTVSCTARAGQDCLSTISLPMSETKSSFEKRGGRRSTTLRLGGPLPALASPSQQTTPEFVTVTAPHPNRSAQGETGYQALTSAQSSNPLSSGQQPSGSPGAQPSDPPGNPPPESHTPASPGAQSTTKIWEAPPPTESPPPAPTQPSWFVGNQTGMIPPNYGGLDLGDGRQYWSWDQVQTETWHHGARNPQALYNCVGHYLDFVLSWGKDPRSVPANGGWVSLELEQGWPCRQANIALRIIGKGDNQLPHHAYSVPLACRMGEKMIEAIRNGAATYSCRVKTAGAMASTQDYADFMWWPLGGPPPPHPHRDTPRENQPDVTWDEQFIGKLP